MGLLDTINTVKDAFGYVAAPFKALGSALTSLGVTDAAQAAAPVNAPLTAAPVTPKAPTPSAGGSAVVVPASAAPAPVAPKTPTAQHVQINGALYNTAEKQQAAFSDIQVVGKIGQPGSYLVGIPKTTATISLPGGTYSAAPTGDVTPGGAALSVPGAVTGSTDTGGIWKTGPRNADGTWTETHGKYEGNTFVPDGQTRTVGTPTPSGGGSGSTDNVTDAGAIKDVAAGGASSDTIAAFLKSVQDQNAEYMRQIGASIMPSAREQTLQQQIDELTNSFKQGKANIEGRPIPLEDIAGQEQQLLQNTETILGPLTAELSRAQTMRTSTGQLLNAAHSIEAQNNNMRFQVLQMQQTEALQASTQTRQFAFDMMKSYPDAGITSADTAQQIATKVAGSEMYKAELAEAKAKGAASKVLGLMSQDEFTRTMAISKEAHDDKDVLLFGQIRDSYNAMLSANAQVKANPDAGGVADLTMLRAYAKMTDPGGRITDGEFETMGDAIGELTKLGIKWTTGMVQGDRLTQTGRDLFVEQARMTYDNYYANYTKAVDYYKNLAIASGVDPTRVISLITANGDLASSGSSGVSDASMANTFTEITGEPIAAPPNMTDTTDTNIGPSIGATEKPRSWWDAAVDWFTGGSKTQKTSLTSPPVINRLAESIGQFESGGRYNAVGPETKYGRAYGKYQVLASNVPAWTREALGTSMSPREFLADKGAQDAVARYKMAQYMKQFGGDLNKVTIAWFAGPGNASKRGVVDQATGVNGHTYLSRVRGIFDNMPA